MAGWMDFIIEEKIVEIETLERSTILLCLTL